jgi:hypothetical protein
MKFRNKKEFRYGIPAQTGPFPALLPYTLKAVWYTDTVTRFVSYRFKISLDALLNIHLPSYPTTAASGPDEKK